MRLAQRMHNGQMWWFADFDNYQSFGIGRVRKMPTVADAMRIVNAWKLIVIDAPKRKFCAWKRFTSQFRRNSHCGNLNGVV